MTTIQQRQQFVVTKTDARRRAGSPSPAPYCEHFCMAPLLRTLSLETVQTPSVLREHPNGDCLESAEVGLYPNVHYRAEPLVFFVSVVFSELRCGPSEYKGMREDFVVRHGLGSQPWRTNQEWSMSDLLLVLHSSHCTPTPKHLTSLIQLY